MSFIGNQVIQNHDLKDNTVKETSVKNPTEWQMMFLKYKMT